MSSAGLGRCKRGVHESGLYNAALNGGSVKVLANVATADDVEDQLGVDASSRMKNLLNKNIGVVVDGDVPA